MKQGIRDQKKNLRALKINAQKVKPEQKEEKKLKCGSLIAAFFLLYFLSYFLTCSTV